MTQPLDLSDRTNMFYWQTNRHISAQQDKDIFLTRHQHINYALVKRAIETGLKKAGFTGRNTQIKEIKPVVPRGLINNVVPVVLESGLEVIIRMHPQGIKNGYFWVEKVATTLVKTQGVPTYTTLIVDDSQDKIPFDYMIMSKEKGRPLQDLWPLNKNLERKLITQTGRLAALIHQVKPEGFGFFINETARKDNKLIGQYKHFREHIYAAFDEDLHFFQDYKVISLDQRNAIEKIFHKHAPLFECKEASLIHNDIADWNQLTNGKEITGMMDWDECFGGDPLMELAAYSLFFGEPRLTWFKEGYNSVGKLEDNEDKFQLFKLRYLISKMHLRKKRSLVDNSSQLKRNLERGFTALTEVFKHFKL